MQRFDREGVARSPVPALVLTTLALLADGYDLGVVGFAVPELVKAWHVSPSDLVPVLSAGVFGLMLGAPLFGYLGDRIGRKTAMLICLLAVGGFSLLNMFATSVGVFVALRFLTGVGLGGVTPVALALAADIAPPRFRGLFVIIVLFGVPAGLILPGWTAALLVPAYGWPALFLVGGMAPLVVAVLSWFVLPELRPAPDRHAVPAGRPALFRELFAGRFAVVTPMFWLMFAANQFTNFFVLGWLPTLLQSAGLTTARAGVNASIYSVGGIVGGLVLLGIIDRLRAVPVIVLFLLGAPAVAAIGMVDPATVLLAAAVAASGFCVTGNNFGYNAVLGMVYPARMRSLGSGLAQAFGRVGALAAQIAGGMLFARHLSMESMYLAPGAVLLVGAAAATVLALACRGGTGTRLDAASPPASLPAAV